MGKKGILFSKLKAEYNLDSRQVQSYWAKAEKYGCSFDRYPPKTQPFASGKVSSS